MQVSPSMPKLELSRIDRYLKIKKQVPSVSFALSSP
jgi:hypothetical protein